MFSGLGLILSPACKLDSVPRKNNQDKISNPLINLSAPLCGNTTLHISCNGMPTIMIGRGEHKDIALVYGHQEDGGRNRVVACYYNLTDMSKISGPHLMIDDELMENGRIINIGNKTDPNWHFWGRDFFDRNIYKWNNSNSFDELDSGWGNRELVFYETMLGTVQPYDYSDDEKWIFYKHSNTEIYFIKYNVSDDSYSPPRIIPTIHNPKHIKHSHINNQHVLAYSPNQPSIYYVNSSDQGLTWSRESVINLSSIHALSAGLSFRNPMFINESGSTILGVSGFRELSGYTDGFNRSIYFYKGNHFSNITDYIGSFSNDYGQTCSHISNNDYVSDGVFYLAALYYTTPSLSNKGKRLQFVEITYKTED